MKNIEIKITNNSSKVLSALNSAYKNGLEAIGERAETYAKKELYPGHGYDMGRLKSSISHARSGMSEYIGTDVEYAVYVEEGSRTNKALHYLRKGATEHSNEYKTLMKDAIKTELQ